MNKHDNSGNANSLTSRLKKENKLKKNHEKHLAAT